jgi:hypothetical protein
VVGVPTRTVAAYGMSMIVKYKDALRATTATFITLKI